MSDFKFKPDDVIKAKVTVQVPERTAVYRVVFTGLNEVYQKPIYTLNLCDYPNDIRTFNAYREVIEDHFELCTTEDLVLLKLEGFI